MTYEEWQLKNDEPHSPKEVWQAAYQAGRDAMKAECVKVCEEQHGFYGIAPAESIKELI